MVGGGQQMFGEGRGSLMRTRDLGVLVYSCKDALATLRDKRRARIGRQAAGSLTSGNLHLKRPLYPLRIKASLPPHY